MLNKIIDFSLKNRLTILILTGLVLVFGTVVLVRSEIDIFPDLNAPTVVVMTEAPGMAAEEVEKLVTYPIETSVNGSTGVRRVRSQSNPGFSVVWVEFDWDTDVYLARQIVSERMASVAEAMPPGVGAPVLGPQSSILGEVMIIGLTADTTSLMELRTIADKNIAPRLLALGGVSRVSVLGGDKKQYRVELSPTLMQQAGVTMEQVLEATKDMNLNAAAGTVYDYGNEYIVKGEINTRNVDDLAKTVVAADEKGIVTLADIGKVTVGGEFPRLGAASLNAKPAVLITVTKQPGVGTIDLTKAIDKDLSDIGRTLPKDVKISTDIFRQSDFIDNSIGNLQQSLLEGALFVIVVLFFFMMNIRTTVVSIVALPLSIILSVIVLNALGYTLNTMSLGGIAIAIGSLVDDAIVDVENVYRHLRENHALPPDQRRPVVKVVYEASAEVRMPIFNSSLIIIASFLPLFFLSGIEGRMLIPLGVAFIVALIASTIVALTLTPVLCSFMLAPKGDKPERGEPRVTRAMRAVYERWLVWSLGHRKSVLIGTIILFAASMGVFFTLGRSFLPGFNEGSLTINVSTLPGVSLDESDRVGRMAEELIMSVPEVQTVARKTGRAELDEHSLGVNVSEIEAPYKLDKRTRGEMTRDIRSKLAQIPGVNVEIGQPISHRIDAMLSGTKAQIAVKLFGNDLEQLVGIGNQIKATMSEVPGVVDVNIEQQSQRPELTIVPRRELMAQYGVTPSQLRQALETAVSGVEVSQVYEDGIPYQVVTVLEPAARNSLQAVGDIPVDTRMGAVPLSQLADVRSLSGPNAVKRENVKRRIVVSANVDGRDLRGTVNDIRANIEKEIKLPENYYIEYGGQFESEASASRTLAWATAGALLVILMLLYHEFKNMWQSAVILVNMPLAMIGGILVLFFSGAELNIPAIIGFISLIGITTRNGMLLISRYNALEEEGEGLHERVMRGSSDRLLPIVMTALTSALALIPLAINGDAPGNEIQSPMATVILGGLLSATLLNVFVVPILYTMLIQRKNRKANLAKVATVAVLAMMAGTAQAQKISPQQAVKNIIDNNVSLKALGSTLEAQRLLEDGEARALEPAEVDFERLWARDGGENRWNAGITQGFDWPGVYAKRRRAADARGMALQLEYNTRMLEVTQEARLAIAEAVYAQKKLTLADNMLQNMSKLAESTNLGYKHGERTILDVKKVNMELATMEWNVSEARNSLATAMATLTALNDNQPLDIDLSVYDLQPLLSLQEYMDNAAKANPAVLAAQQQSTAAGLRADAAKAAMLPGFSVGLRHAYEEETHYNGISVGVKLPFLGNRQAQKAALMEADGYTAQAIAETATATAQTQALYNQATRMRERFVALSKSTLQEDYPRLLDMAFKGGEINMLTYLQELNYYLDACSNLLDAEYSLNTTLINLNRYSTPL